MPLCVALLISFEWCDEAMSTKFDERKQCFHKVKIDFINCDVKIEIRL